MVSITRPNSPDLSVRNAKEFVYVKGDADTDGSLRFDPSVANVGAVSVQLRTDGVWDRTALDVSGDTIHLGHDLSLAASGEWLRTYTIVHDHNSLIPHTHLTDAEGTTQLHTPAVSLKYYRNTIQPTYGGIVDGALITDTLEISHRTITTKLYLKCGLTAVTEPVTLTIRKGSFEGDLFWQRDLPVSMFPVGRLGDYSEVIDASVFGAQISSVTDDGSGTAVFHTPTPHGLSVSQILQAINGFPPQTYDGPGFVAAINSPDTFEITRTPGGPSIGYLGPGSGTYDTASATIVAPNNDMNDLELVRLYDGAVYNGSFTVYNTQPNSFDFDINYGGDSSGSWNGSTDIEIDLGGDVSADAGDVWYITLESAAPMSFVTDPAGALWSAADFQLVETIDIVENTQLFTAEADVIINDEAEYTLWKVFQSGTYRLS